MYPGRQSQRQPQLVETAVKASAGHSGSHQGREQGWVRVGGWGDVRASDWGQREADEVDRKLVQVPDRQPCAQEASAARVAKRNSISPRAEEIEDSSAGTVSEAHDVRLAAVGEGRASKMVAEPIVGREGDYAGRTNA